MCDIIKEQSNNNMRAVPRTKTHTYTRDIHTWQSHTHTLTLIIHTPLTLTFVCNGHTPTTKKEFVQRGNKKMTSASLLWSSLTALRVTKYRLSLSTVLLAALFNCSSLTYSYTGHTPALPKRLTKLKRRRCCRRRCFDMRRSRASIEVRALCTRSVISRPYAG